MARPKSSPEDKLARIRKAIERDAGPATLAGKTDAELLMEANLHAAKLRLQQQVEKRAAADGQA